VKQAFIHFAYLSQHFRYQGKAGAIYLQSSFKKFVELIEINDLEGKSWPIAATQVPAEIERDVKATIVVCKECDK